MKIHPVILFAAALLACARPADAADNALDVRELTCQQFSGYDDNNKGLVMMWFEGYYTEEDEDAVIDFGKMAGHLTKLLIACQANPSKEVLDLADDAMGD
jgi:HdeA/HdeB family